MRDAIARHARRARAPIRPRRRPCRSTRALRATGGFSLAGGGDRRRQCLIEPARPLQPLRLLPVARALNRRRAASQLSPGRPFKRPVTSVRSCARCARDATASSCPPSRRSPKSSQEDPFQVLIGTLLSARTRDATTAAALRQAVRGAPHARRRWLTLTVKRIEQLIYPVSFYRHKARHVKATLPDPRRSIRRPRAGDDGGAADAAGRRAARRPTSC